MLKSLPSPLALLHVRIGAFEVTRALITHLFWYGLNPLIGIVARLSNVVSFKFWVGRGCVRGGGGKTFELEFELKTLRLGSDGAAVGACLPASLKLIGSPILLPTSLPFLRTSKPTMIKTRLLLRK